jgi:erythritol transport system ATP-binding protein
MGAGRTELFECMLGTERNYLGKLWLDKNRAAAAGDCGSYPHGDEPGTGRQKRTGFFPGSSVATT